MIKDYEKLIEQLNFQENVIANGILEIQNQMRILWEIQDRLMEKNSQLVDHLDPKKRALKVLHLLMDNTLIMIDNDTLEAFIQRQEKNNGM